MHIFLSLRDGDSIRIRWLLMLNSKLCFCELSHKHDAS